MKKNGYIDAKYNYKEESKKITSRVITPLADKIGCYNDLMGIGENTNKGSSKHQQLIGENAKDIYNNINIIIINIMASNLKDTNLIEIYNMKIWI